MNHVNYEEQDGYALGPSFGRCNNNGSKMDYVEKLPQAPPPPHTVHHAKNEQAEAMKKTYDKQQATRKKSPTQKEGAHQTKNFVFRRAETKAIPLSLSCIAQYTVDNGDLKACQSPPRFQGSELPFHGLRYSEKIREDYDHVPILHELADLEISINSPETVDVISDRNCLRKLLNCLMYDPEDKTNEYPLRPENVEFQFNVEKHGNTIVLHRDRREGSEEGFGFPFERHVTDNHCKGCVYRVMQGSIGVVNCVVRCELDCTYQQDNGRVLPVELKSKTVKEMKQRNGKYYAPDTPEVLKAYWPQLVLSHTELLVQGELRKSKRDSKSATIHDIRAYALENIEAKIFERHKGDRNRALNQLQECLRWIQSALNDGDTATVRNKVCVKNKNKTMSIIIENRVNNRKDDERMTKEECLDQAVVEAERDGLDTVKVSSNASKHKKKSAAATDNKHLPTEEELLDQAIAEAERERNDGGGGNEGTTETSTDGKDTVKVSNKANKNKKKSKKKKK